MIFQNISHNYFCHRYYPKWTHIILVDISRQSHRHKNHLTYTSKLWAWMQWWEIWSINAATFPDDRLAYGTNSFCWKWLTSHTQMTVRELLSHICITLFRYSTKFCSGNRMFWFDFEDVLGKFIIWSKWSTNEVKITILVIFKEKVQTKYERIKILKAIVLYMIGFSEDQQYRLEFVKAAVCLLVTMMIYIMYRFTLQKRSRKSAWEVFSFW